jgi:hypothetical protein
MMMISKMIRNNSKEIYSEEDTSNYHMKSVEASGHKESWTIGSQQGTYLSSRGNPEGKKEDPLLTEGRGCRVP